MHSLRLILLALVVSVGLTFQAEAGKRIALVIGNSAYENISALENPKNDAELIAETLREVGFEVVTAIDADRRTMGRAVRKFGKQLRLAGKDAVGLFYFAGHGVQARGANYLIPVRALVEDHADLQIEALSASDVLSQMESAGNALNLVILDACRNNPFKGSIRASERGLARITAASGSLISFAAAPGQVATDGKGRNSPFTAALAEAIRTPGAPVEQIFKQVRVRVEKETGGQQTPWEESSLRGDFYFVPKQVEPVIAQTPQPTGFDERALELSFWNSVKGSENPTMLQTYLDHYPQGIFSALAKVMIEELEPKAQPQAEPPAQEAEEEVQVAAVDPEEATKTEESDDSDPDLPRKLQTALTEAGCNPGKIDGQWGRNSTAALDRFARHAKVTLPDEPVSAETLKLLRGRDGRVCPLVCGARHVERNGRCVVKNCPGGQRLNASGACVRVVRDQATNRKPAKQTKAERCGLCQQNSGPKGGMVRVCGKKYEWFLINQICN